MSSDHDPRAACAPIVAHRDWQGASVFRPQDLLREARRQKGLRDHPVPPICVLDPDGDLARHVQSVRAAQPEPDWACYHTTLLGWDSPGGRVGVVPYTVGAAFAVLVAEQLFASGCRLLINLTSAGQLTDLGPPPYFVVIDRALRDEGTSYHYAPPSEYAEADPGLIQALWPALSAATNSLRRGSSWTTDAPFRETEAAIAAQRARGLLLVEMETAALYAFAATAARPVLSVAHVTNRMGQEGDFEKGDAQGASDALRLIEAAALAWHSIGPHFVPRSSGTGA